MYLVNRIPNMFKLQVSPYHLHLKEFQTIILLRQVSIVIQHIQLHSMIIEVAHLLQMVLHNHIHTKLYHSIILKQHLHLSIVFRHPYQMADSIRNN